MCPTRELELPLESTPNDAVPLPMTEPEVTVIQLESLVAIQKQPLWVFTEKLLEPPPEPKLWPDEESA